MSGWTRIWIVISVVWIAFVTTDSLDRVTASHANILKLESELTAATLDEEAILNRNTPILGITFELEDKSKITREFEYTSNKAKQEEIAKSIASEFYVQEDKYQSRTGFVTDPYKILQLNILMEFQRELNIVESAQSRVESLQLQLTKQNRLQPKILKNALLKSLALPLFTILVWLTAMWVRAGFKPRQAK